MPGGSRGSHGLPRALWKPTGVQLSTGRQIRSGLWGDELVFRSSRIQTRARLLRSRLVQKCRARNPLRSLQPYGEKERPRSESLRPLGASKRKEPEVGDRCNHRDLRTGRYHHLRPGWRSNRGHARRGARRSLRSAPQITELIRLPDSERCDAIQATGPSGHLRQAGGPISTATPVDARTPYRTHNYEATGRR